MHDVITLFYRNGRINYCRLKKMKRDNSKLLFVNSLDGSGIGDFGKSLFSGIGSERIEKFYTNTNDTMRSLFANWIKIFRFPGKILINLGFTSYGKSPFINFANFVFIFIHYNLFTGKIQVILHDSPDLTTNEAAGYEHFNFMKLGGAIATRLLKKLRVHVFSITLLSILKNKYEFENVYFHPFPCLETKELVRSRIDSDISVINIGYIAPYKGLELIQLIKQAIPDVNFILSGASHLVLSKTEKGKEYINDLISRLSDVGVEIRGYIQEKEMDKLVSEMRIVGILPYVTTSGSSYAAIFFIERGIPIIASDLPEFRALYDHGAGIILSERTLEKFSSNIEKLRNNKEFYQDLVNKNKCYCIKNSINNFLDELDI